MFSYVSLGQRVPKDHPLRTLRALVDGILANMGALFDERHSHAGRPSIPPEQLLRALLLQILFTLRSERQLVEHLDYNRLFRWFVGLAMDDVVRDREVFSINRDRLLDDEPVAVLREHAGHRPCGVGSDHPDGGSPRAQTRLHDRCGQGL